MGLPKYAQPTPALRRTKTKRRHRRPNQKNNNDQPKNPTNAQSPNRGKDPAPCHAPNNNNNISETCPPLSGGGFRRGRPLRNHPAELLPPTRGEEETTTTNLSKAMTANKGPFACAAATLHARSDHGSGPFLVPFWARKKEQKENQKDGNKKETRH